MVIYFVRYPEYGGSGFWCYFLYRIKKSRIGTLKIVWFGEDSGLWSVGIEEFFLYIDRKFQKTITSLKNQNFSLFQICRIIPDIFSAMQNTNHCVFFIISMGIEEVFYKKVLGNFTLLQNISAFHSLLFFFITSLIIFSI